MQGDTDNRLQHEALFRAAEIRALTSKRLKSHLSLVRDRSAPDENERILHAARMELHRRAVRLRHIPEDLVSDHAWIMLVDLFVSEHEMRQINVVEPPARWNLSPGTAARHIAALIETNLVSRVFDETDHAPTSLRLTDLGKLYVKSILALSE
jgi:hypothetical protein